MSMATVERAQAEQGHPTFEQLAAPFRREIKLHCYRMMGSLHEAEDLVQETYLRAWRSFDGFDGKSPRAWLYRIATNACLNALASRKQAQRLLPDQLVAGTPATEVTWLEPYPDAQMEGIADETPSPEARYTSGEAVKLAFVAGLQQLPPKQRAVLMLCDVLGWPAAEAATLLEGSTASINSALQRARETLSQRRPVAAPGPAKHELLGRYLQSWQGHDVDGFVALLKEDATCVMPPMLQWFVGREAIGAFFAEAWKTCGGLRLVPTAANGQPAFGVYERPLAGGAFAAHSLHVLTLENEAVSAMTLFVEPRLVLAFGLPPEL
jgi:RNA polymerase sigma-70 factor (ECF subfamily)